MAEAFGIACHQLVSLDFRFGSTCDIRLGCLPRPELGVERTQSGEKQTSPTECRLLGVDRTYLGHAPNVAS